MEKAPVIQRLEQNVVNRIAAGEVIQHPYNVIKELIENSLDAGATSIKVDYKKKGLKLIQITDNGHGIKKEDFEIVCERFTTSKLSDFEDLKSISTFGFRGEALASISHVAHLYITSKTNGSKCAYKASYTNGKMISSPSPLAGRVGTQITVEDLFYNLPIRQKACGENDIYSLMKSYALHNSGISFTLRDLDSNSSVINTQLNSSIVDNFSYFFTSGVVKELLNVEETSDKLKFKFTSYFTNANYSVNNFLFILFINNRLVDCVSLKRSLKAIYQTYLPKQKHPIIYISLTLDPKILDVNIHPTKHEVQFLHEDLIVEYIQSVIEGKLLECDSSRTFYVQNLVPQTSKRSNDEEENQSRCYDHKLVRTDCKSQKIEKVIRSNLSQSACSQIAGSQSAVNQSAGSQSAGNQSAVNQSAGNQSAGDQLASSQQLVNEKTLTAANLPRIRKIDLTAILKLQSEISKQCNADLLKIIQDHTFVGCIDVEKALVQHKTNLYLVNTEQLSRNLFYQIIIHDFGNFGLLRLSKPASIRKLAMLGLELKETGWSPTDGSKDDLVEYVAKLLETKSEMLAEYFSINIKVHFTFIYLKQSSIVYFIEW